MYKLWKEYTVCQATYEYTMSTENRIQDSPWLRVYAYLWTTINNEPQAPPVNLNDILTS